MNIKAHTKNRIVFHPQGSHVSFAVIGLVLVLASVSYAAAVDVIGSWESMPTSGDGWIDWGQGQAAIETLPAKYQAGTVGATLGSQSLHMIQAGGATQSLAIKLNAAQREMFMSHDTFSIDMSVAASSSYSPVITGGYTQIYLVYMNAAGPGWTAVTGTTPLNFYWWNGSPQRTSTLTIDYTAFRDAITSTGYIEIILSLNNGGGAPPDMYFDNARLSGGTVPPQRLHVEGNKIKNEDGNDVTLRGVSLIDVGQQEDWQDGVNTMIDRLTNTEDNNCDSAGWHPNIIRLPVFAPSTHTDTSPWPYEFQNDPAGLYNVLKSAVDYCAEKNVYAVIDWHDINDMTPEKIAEANDFWEYMAPLFADDTHVIFELFNEPINRTGTDEENWAVVKAGMETLISTVRAYAPHTLLMIGTPRWCQIIGPTVDDPLDDPNVVYVSHIYPSHWNSSDYSYYTSSIATADACHPVILGEWGFMENSTTLFDGTIANYGDPLRVFVEGLGIGNIAWVAGHGDWLPPMFDYNDSNHVWTLLEGDGYMGCFVKDWLYDAWSDTQETTTTIALTISGCEVTAGAVRGQDSITAVGTMASLPPSLVGVETIDVNIVSGVDGNDIYTEDVNFTWDTSNNRLVWTTSRTSGITQLSLDFSTRIFVIVAKNINLTGLGAPVHLDLTIGNCILSGDADESIVNRGNPIPIQLMGGYRNSLDVKLGSVSDSTASLQDNFYCIGNITAQDISGSNLISQAVVITWANQGETVVQNFTLPAGRFSRVSGNSYQCTNALTSEGARVTATINLDACTFSVLVQNTNLSVTSGIVKFGISFTGFDETDDITNLQVSRPTTVRRLRR